MEYNNKLKNNIERFVNKLDYSITIKNKLGELLNRYNYCESNNLLHYPIKMEDINKNEFNRHLIGFLDGDGILRSGKRKGHRKGYYRFAPNMGLKLHEEDSDYLYLIISYLDLKKKTLSKEDITNKILNISSVEDLSKIMYILDNHQPFISKKRSRDYRLFKELIKYLEETKLIAHNEEWLKKGIDIIKDLNTYNNLPSGEKVLQEIKDNLTWDYILGFIEAEGSLIMHYNTQKNYIFNSFEITQNKANGLILEGILDFIKNYNDNLIINKDIEIKTKGIVEDNSKTRKNLLNRLTLTNNEVLYYKIIPLLVHKNLYSKMQINLIYFIFGVIICKDLKEYDECVKLYLEIKDVINTHDTKLLDLNYILTILNKYL